MKAKTVILALSLATAILSYATFEYRTQYIHYKSVVDVMIDEQKQDRVATTIMSGGDLNRFLPQLSWQWFDEDRDYRVLLRDWRAIKIIGPVEK